MKILYVNAVYFGGGAEKIARQLYFKMKDKDTQTYFMAGRYQKNLPDFINVAYDSFICRVISAITGILNHNVLFFTLRARRRIIKIIKREKIDIVHLHNTHGNYLGISDIKRIGKHCSGVVITMHDMWLLTGCCPHAMSCKKWKFPFLCHRCTGNEFLKKGSRRASVYLKCKAHNLEKSEYFFVSPSEWLIDCCKQSYLKCEDIKLIRNGVDTDVFLPQDKMAMREKYGIPIAKKVLMFSANVIESPFKGFFCLCQSLEYLSNKEEYTLLVIGKDSVKISLPFDVIAIDYANDEKIMNELYAAADVYILPSMADTAPLTPLEAMASGTPVIAFKTGGIPEVVTEEVGWTVAQGDSKALAEMIENVFRNGSELIKKSEKCREYVKKNYSIEDMVEKYKAIYEEIFQSL